MGWNIPSSQEDTPRSFNLCSVGKVFQGQNLGFDNCLLQRGTKTRSQTSTFHSNFLGNNPLSTGMAQWVKVPVAIPADLSPIPGTTWWKERAHSASCSQTSACAPWCTHTTHTLTHTHIHTHTTHTHNIHTHIQHTHTMVHTYNNTHSQHTLTHIQHIHSHVHSHTHTTHTHHGAHI